MSPAGRARHYEGCVAAIHKLSAQRHTGRSLRCGIDRDRRGDVSSPARSLSPRPCACPPPGSEQAQLTDAEWRWLCCHLHLVKMVNSISVVFAVPLPPLRGPPSPRERVWRAAGCGPTMGAKMRWGLGDRRTVPLSLRTVPLSRPQYEGTR